MECSIIKDLIPLYVDDCCSDESRNCVETHIETCAVCRGEYERMKDDIAVVSANKSAPPEKCSRISGLKASILQSLLLFASFIAIIIGVVIEAASPSSSASNGFAAFNIIVPATGFMLSLANWYFVRSYKSRRQFSVASAIVTLLITIAGFVWWGWHYDVALSGFFGSFGENISSLWLGCVLTVVVCVLSGVLSAIYAKLLGKE